jgi:hypothetical protein
LVFSFFLSLLFFLFFSLFFPFPFSSSKDRTSGWRGVSHSNRMFKQCDIENRWGAGIFGAGTELEKHGLWERKSQGYGGWLSERSWVSTPIAAGAVNKASRFVAHLLALLRSHYRTWYISGYSLMTFKLHY